MIFSGGDFDDAIDVVDVWLYVEVPTTKAANDAPKTIFSH